MNAPSGGAAPAAAAGSAGQADPYAMCEYTSIHPLSAQRN
jgi:hypothetical protein